MRNSDLQLASSEVIRRAFLSNMALFSAGLLVSGCFRSDDRKGTLRVSTVGKGQGNSDLLLRAASLNPQGYVVDYINFQAGQFVVEALNTGSLDFATLSEIPPIFAAASAVQNFRQIAVLHGDVNNQVVLVPKGSSITDLAGLKGKRVGYVRATTSQYFLIRMLQSVGLKWGDITSVALGVPDGQAAFSSGALDAWAIYGFPIQRAIATEGARVLKTALGFLSGNYIFAAHVDALNDPAKADLIRRYLQLNKQAYAWAAVHRDALAAAVSSDIGVPLDYVKDQFHRASAISALRPVDEAAIRSQQAIADLFADQKMIPRRVDVRPLWNDRFNPMLQQEA